MDILAAAKAGDEKEVVACLAAFPPNLPDSEGYTPLHHSTLGRFLAASSALVDAKADVNARTKSGKTPLHIAASQGDLSLVQALLIWNAEVNARDTELDTPLMLAAANAHEDTASFLVRQGASIRLSNKECKTALDVSSPALAALLHSAAQTVSPLSPVAGAHSPRSVNSNSSANGLFSPSAEHRRFFPPIAPLGTPVSTARSPTLSPGMSPNLSAQSPEFAGLTSPVRKAVATPDLSALDGRELLEELERARREAKAALEAKGKAEARAAAMAEKAQAVKQLAGAQLQETLNKLEEAKKQLEESEAARSAAELRAAKMASLARDMKQECADLKDRLAAQKQA